MPASIKLGVSVAALIVAGVFAYYESVTGRGDLTWVVVGTGIFMVLAMWIFPETGSKKEGRPKS